MSNERVQFNLTERFAAPLPEFYRRRIVFWKDEDREFEKDVDELNLEGVKIIKLTGTNNFAVKKLLLHDDLESDYLVYCPRRFYLHADGRVEYRAVCRNAEDGQALCKVLRQQRAYSKAAQDRAGLSDAPPTPYRHYGGSRRSERRFCAGCHHCRPCCRSR